MSSGVSPGRVLAVVGLLALAACESMDDSFGNAFEDSFEMGGSDFAAWLRGANEPEGGDLDGTGIARIRFADTGDRICARFQTDRIGTITAAHIHRGSSQAVDAPVVTLDPPDGDWLDDCVAVEKGLLDEIRDNPAGFYVNVHTADHPGGAIRGQLARAMR
jgi:hypothetical protein